MSMGHPESQRNWLVKVGAWMRRRSLRRCDAKASRESALVSSSQVTALPGVDTYHIPNLVKRVWDQGDLDAVWISDITYLRTWEGFVYLCVIRDGCSRRVLGWAMDDRQDSDLVERALRMAHTLRAMTPGN